MGNFWSTSSFFGLLAGVVLKQHCKTRVFASFLDCKCIVQHLKLQVKYKRKTLLRAGLITGIDFI
jgi:hypothetical protein